MSVNLVPLICSPVSRLASFLPRTVTVTGSGLIFITNVMGLPALSITVQLTTLCIVSASDETFETTLFETDAAVLSAFSCGLGYKYGQRSQAYFDYSRAYRMPNTEECYTNKYFAWGQYGGG